LNPRQKAYESFPSDTIRRLGKSHVDYWAPRLTKRSYLDRDGKTVEISDWQIRVSHLGRREFFNLGTANKAAAAVKARDIYLSLLSAGWEPTMTKFKPDQVVDKDCATVSEYLDVVKTNSELRLVTFETYGRKFRTLVARVRGRVRQRELRLCERRAKEVVGSRRFHPAQPDHGSWPGPPPTIRRRSPRKLASGKWPLRR
jgi:hypothetical protein